MYLGRPLAAIEARNADKSTGKVSNDQEQFQDVCRGSIILDLPGECKLQVAVPENYICTRVFG